MNKQFDPERLAMLRAACVREWNAEIERDPDSFRTASGGIATGEGIAVRMFGAIERASDCGSVCFLQSKAIGRAARSLGLKFTIKECNAWLRRDTHRTSDGKREVFGTLDECIAVASETFRQSGIVVSVESASGAT